MVDIRPTDFYVPADDLWIVTCYFNPESYVSRLENYTRFKVAIERSHVPFITVECAFRSQPFVLSGPNIIQLRATDVIWQKERLLNFAISELPGECRKVAWLDSDVLFHNPTWLLYASKLLDHFALIQPFQKVVGLPKQHTSYIGEAILFRESFASVFSSAPTRHLTGNFLKHGHTGFAWAARRDLLSRHGLYESCIAGSGDHMIAHAACGDWDSDCIYSNLASFAHRKHFREWAVDFYKDVRGLISYVPGTVLHLWHGDTRNRRYGARLAGLAAFDFDPTRDIRVGRSGVLEWNSPLDPSSITGQKIISLRDWKMDKAVPSIPNRDTEHTVGRILFMLSFS